MSAAPIAPAGDPGMPWCVKLDELYCNAATRALPDGESRCARTRAIYAARARGSEARRRERDAECRGLVELHAPANGEAPEDLPACKRLAFAYCTPEVSKRYGSARMCAMDLYHTYYTPYVSLPREARISANSGCEQALRRVPAAR
jgi:hypothetical protein